MFTVNMPLRLTNSLVPSRGSTSQQVSDLVGSPRRPSSETMGVSGSILESPFAMTSCAARSASVSGESSSLVVTLIELGSL